MPDDSANDNVIGRDVAIKRAHDREHAAMAKQFRSTGYTRVVR